MKTLLKGAAVFDALRDRVRADVLVEDGRILKVGAELPAEGAEVIDLTGCTLFPGFVDSHVHVAVDNAGYKDDAIRAWAYNGVTTVKELGMLTPLSAESYIEWLNTKTGPEYTHVIPAAKYIDVEGGYGCGPNPAAKVGIIIETPEQAADAVTWQHNNGSICIKIGISEGRPCLTPEMIRAICERANSLGMWVAVHLGLAETLELVADCGALEAAHTPQDPMSDALIAKCVEKGIIMDTTIGDPDRLPGPPPPQDGDDSLTPVDLPKFDPEEMAKREAERRRGMIANMVRYHKAGGVLAIGTDFIFSNDIPHDACIPVAEMRQLHEAGISMQDIIRMATLNGALSCRTAEEEGSVEEGKLANLVAIRGELDERFEALRSPVFVMNRGTVIRNEL